MKEQETQEAREARLAYYKEWRKNNKEKIKTYNKRFWERMAAKQEEKK